MNNHECNDPMCADHGDSAKLKIALTALKELKRHCDNRFDGVDHAKKVVYEVLEKLGELNETP